MAEKRSKDILDVAKFFLSILVVMIHTRFLGSYTQYIYPSVRLAVPVFFILSGFFAFAKLDALPTYEEKKKALRKLVKRYLQLYAFWFVALLPYTLFIRHYFKDGIILGILKMVQAFFLGSTFPGSWYLMGTILGIIIVFYLSQKFSNKFLLVAAIPFYLFATLTSEFAGYIAMRPQMQEAYTAFAGVFGDPCFTFMIALVYIVIGKMIAAGTFQKCSKSTCLTLFAASFALLILEHYFLTRQEWAIYSCDGLLLLAPTAAFLTFALMKQDIHVPFAKSLRGISTIVYCSHFFFNTIFSKIIGILQIPDPLNLIQFLLTYGASFVLAVIFLKLEKNQKHKIFGLLKYAH